MRETIPDEHRVVRFLLKAEIVEYNGRVYPAMHAFHDPELSVDWIEKSSIDEGYARKPKSVGHAVFVVSKIRAIGAESVQHKPADGNDAHAECICSADLEKKKRPTAACHAFVSAVQEAGFRPAGDPSG